MAWNEPGDNKDENKSNDPWSGREKKSSKPKDLDDALGQLQKKFTKLINKKSSKDGGKDGSGNTAGAFWGVGILFVALIVIWFITGFFVVQPPEKAVVLRFGKYAETLDPGLHWIPRFVDSETKVNVEKVYSYTYPSSGDALMLTQDQNIVAVAITVQFKVENPQDFLFNTVSPIDSLHQATASALRQVVGQTNLDNILTIGREQLRQEVKTQLEQTLVRYQTGLTITNVLLKSAQAPEAVKDAFDDAVKAQEDEKRYVNQAQAYSMKVEPIAKGQAQRILAAAEAYKQQVTLNAKAKVAPFLALLPEYKKAPEVMRERMYLDALQNVFEQSSKVLIDSSKGTNNLLYLPLEKMLMPPKKAEKAINYDDINMSSSKIPTVPDTQTTTSQSARPTRENAGYSYGDIGGTR